MNPITEVIFRKFKSGKKEIIAVFPYDIGIKFGNCSSYMHVGQHGDCNYNHIINITKPAKEEEYSDLKRELENYGPKEANYNLKVIQKINWHKHKKEFSKTKT